MTAKVYFKINVSHNKQLQMISKMLSMSATKSPNNSVLASTLSPLLSIGWLNPTRTEQEHTPADWLYDTDAAGHKSQQSIVSWTVTNLTAWSGVSNCSLAVTCFFLTNHGGQEEGIIKMAWLGHSHIKADV